MGENQPPAGDSQVSQVGSGTAAEPQPPAGTPAAAGAPAAPEQASGTPSAGETVSPAELAEYRAWTPFYQELKAAKPEVQEQVMGLLGFGESAPSTPAPATSPGAVGGGDISPALAQRLAAMEQSVQANQTVVRDLVFEARLAQGERQHGDEWDEGKVIAHMTQHNIDDPLVAYNAMRGASLTPERIEELVTQRTQERMAAASGNAAVPPAGAGPSGMTATPTPGADGMIGPALIQDEAKERFTPATAPLPPGLPTEGTPQ